jgi:hypothetical protein
MTAKRLDDWSREIAAKNNGQLLRFSVKNHDCVKFTAAKDFGEYKRLFCYYRSPGELLAALESAGQA